MKRVGAPAGALLACHVALGAGAPAPAAGDAAAEADWTAAATRAMAASCAVRQLTLKWPVRVRSMADYGGGYTAGVGSVAWSGEHAETWRAGWCAVGVYCAPSPARGAPGGVRFNAPRGLYSHARATLYVRDPRNDAQTRATVAHEVVHALQYQNFPMLNAPHLWFNRDLSAAVDAVVEGDAHLVGWSLDAQRRRHLCSADPAATARVYRDWWRWTPQAITAMESFPHVFGPGLVLARLLAGDTREVNALLLDPPLSALATLRPESAGPVDFIALPKGLAQRVGNKKCSAGLTNTVGVVGIWGLLAQHEGAAAEAELPEFLTQWSGDRFAHLACAGERNDELAWLTRWRTPAAAMEFARRFNAVAAAAARHGDVLGAPARAVARASTALVATPALAAAADALFQTPVRTFERYADWIAADCFPDACHREADFVVGARRARAAFACATAAPPPPAFRTWLDRVRQARARARELQGETLAFALRDAGRLAVFCALNARRNADVLAACRAASFGLRHLAALAEDGHWRLLPLCASGAEYRAQLRPVLGARGSGSAPQRELHLRTAGSAAAALRAGGVQGVRQLAAAAPLSTLALLDPEFDGAVEFLHLPPAALAESGCEVLASDVVGALGLWTRLRALGSTAPADVPPAIVRAWRGDRQWYLRCGGESGWFWATRWADAAAAREFAVRYLPALGVGVDAPPDVAGRTVWSVPAGLAGVKALVKASVKSRFFASFSEWRAAGCYPQPTCRE